MFVLCYGHLVCFTYIWYILWPCCIHICIVEIFPVLVNCTKKSGNPAFSVIKSASTFLFSRLCRKLWRQFAKRQTQKRREMQAAEKSWSPQVPIYVPTLHLKLKDSWHTPPYLWILHTFSFSKTLVLMHMMLLHISVNVWKIDWSSFKWKE
jgi:hypothetical protein